MQIFDFELSDEEMHRISTMGGSDGRLTDYGFAPKWD
jgi:2,5-diketo-D-gluconate reductase B